MAWVIELDFSALYSEFEDWLDADLVAVTKSFEDEEDAREFFEDAHTVLEEHPWLDDEEGCRPSEEMLDFARRHNIVVYDLDGVPDGGYINGTPVGHYTLALQGILRAIETRDMREEWLTREPIEDPG